MSCVPSLVAGHHEIAGDLLFEDAPSFLSPSVHTASFLCVCLCAQFLSVHSILD